MSWHAVAKVGDVRAGDVIAVEVDGLQLVLAREGDAYYALQRTCVHLGGDLANGIVARGHVVCPHHGWRFSIATGQHDRASNACLVRYATRVVGDQVEIDPTPLRGTP